MIEMRTSLARSLAALTGFDLLLLPLGCTKKGRERRGRQQLGAKRFVTGEAV